MFESRKYSALAFSAFKNYEKCFMTILNHGKQYNITDTIVDDTQPTAEL